MSRACIADVRAILPAESQLTDPQIQAALDAAACTVDQIAEGCASHLSEDCLAQVEAWLAAHFAAAMENSLSLSAEKDACSGSTATYGFKFGEGVRGTPYGQMANTLSGGCLAELDMPKARMYSIGGH